MNRHRSGSYDCRPASSSRTNAHAQAMDGSYLGGKLELSKLVILGHFSHATPPNESLEAPQQELVVY